MNTNLSLLFCMFFFSVLAQTEPKNTEPLVLGQRHSLFSQVLHEERILNVYLPEGYNPSDSARYPVIYLLDGSFDEDFIHVVGLVQYYSFEWINLVPKSIVVGIATVDRRRDFTFPSQVEEEKARFPTSGHSDTFIGFIETELQPYIARQFKTNGERTLIGQSFGGLVSTEILLRKPHLFNRYIIVSPSLWWDNGSLLGYPMQDVANVEVYIGVGKEGLTPGKNPRVMEVDANLLADRLRATEKDDVRICFDYLPEENHATILHPAVLNAFKMLYAPSKE